MSLEGELEAKGVHLVQEVREEVQYSMLKHLVQRCRNAMKYIRVVAWLLKIIEQFPKEKIGWPIPGAEHLHHARQDCSKITQKDIKKDLEESSGKYKGLGP